MALVLRLTRQVALETLWLDKAEWQTRYRGDLARLVELLDGSGQTVLEDVGGFEQLVTGAAWADRMEKFCRGCQRWRSVADFRLQEQNRNRALLVVRPRCRECEIGAVYDRRHQLETVGSG